MSVNENRMTLLTLDPLHTDLSQGDQALADYHALRDALPEEDTLGLSGARVLIIGGGIIGLMSAYYAAAAGAQVTVLESRALGGAASGRNAGGIYANGRDIGEVAMARVSMELWEALGRRGLDVKFQRRGHTIVAMNDWELSLLTRAEAIYRRAGMPVEVRVGAAAVSELPLVNPAISGALFSPADGQGYPFTAVASLRNAVRQLGGTVQPFSPVTRLLESRGRVVGAATAQHTVAADAVLLAVGPWTAQFGDQLGINLPVRPRRSQLTASERLPLSKNFPFVSGNRVYARQTHADNILIGGGGSWEQNGYQTNTTRQALAVYARYMTEMFPGLARVPVIRAFAGTVELTPDHYPLLGAVPGAPGLWVSAGYNGHGFGLSAVAGRVFAALLAHEMHEQQAPEALRNALKQYAPHRFVDHQEPDKDA